jgi:cytidine deaminase
MSSITDPLDPIPYPELIFGLVGPAGTDLNTLEVSLRRHLNTVGYKAHKIRLSDQLPAIEQFEEPETLKEDERIQRRMDFGTKLRSDTGRGDILVHLGISEIRDFRLCQTGESAHPIERQSYILHSLKHPKEVQALRAIYGRQFFTIAGYSPRNTRVEALAHRIADSHNDPDINKYRSHAESIISRDEKEEGTKLGQNVSDTFAQADVFVDTSHPKAVDEQVRRFIYILFGYPFYTPYPDEFAMYFAKAAALQSADLSRQVGAAIVEEPFEIVSVGCNEVPAAGGGPYWPGPMDHRDYVLGEDSNSHHKFQIIRQIVDKLHDKQKLSEDWMAYTPDQLSRRILTDETENIFQDTQIFDLLEFGRPVHAEMMAISRAARSGKSVKDTSLFCTTFPCHMCARHIISSGIKRVVYIEPYPKSKVKDLYDDSVAIDDEYRVENKVNFTPFVGIAPNRFQELFEFPKGERKERDGSAKTWVARDSRPRISRVVNTYPLVESKVVSEIESNLNKGGFTIRESRDQGRQGNGKQGGSGGSNKKS